MTYDSKLFKNVPAIYKIVNKINNKIYVGSTKNLKERLGSHFNDLSKNKHENQYFQNDFNKTKKINGLGKENYNVYILEEFSWFNEKFLIKREQYYIDKFWDNKKQCLNLNEIAGKPPTLSGAANGMFGKTFTPEQMQNLINSHIGQGIKEVWAVTKDLKKYYFKSLNEAGAFFGFKGTGRISRVCSGHRETAGGIKFFYEDIDETKIIFKEKNTGFKKGNKICVKRTPWNKGLPCSDETKKKISDKNKNYRPTNEIKKKISDNSTSKRKIIAFNIITKKSIIFNSIKEASDTLKINLRGIFKVLSPNDMKVKIKNWTFSYA